MQTHHHHLFRLFLLAIIGLIILSCSLPSSREATAIPTLTSQPVVEQATDTQAPPPTETTAPTMPVATGMVPTISIPTDPPAQQAQAEPTVSLEAPDFFTEEFDGDLSNWEYFFTSGDEDLASFYTEDGRLSFYLNGEQIYAYLLYSPYYYEDVVLTVEAENRGYNNNNVSLICRYDYERGWYEFSIANNGLYWIYYYDILTEGGYNVIAEGGSNSIRTGRDVNTYSIVCRGKTLILYINGQETRRLEETRYVLKEGQVGVGVSSFDVLPIEVEFEYMTIDYP